MAVCPNDPEHKSFSTCATVMEDWVVDKYGEFQSTIASIDTVHGPDPDNYWQCNVCGRDAIIVDTIACSLCGEPCNKETAHLHQDQYIGDECCWDERLRSSE